MNHYSGPYGNRIDGFKSGEKIEVIFDDGSYGLELKRAIKLNEFQLNSLRFDLLHADLISVECEMEEGTNVIPYY